MQAISGKARTEAVGRPAVAAASSGDVGACSGGVDRHEAVHSFPANRVAARLVGNRQAVFGHSVVQTAFHLRQTRAYHVSDRGPVARPAGQNA